MGKEKGKGKGNWYTRHFGLKGLKGTGTEPGVVESPKGWAQDEIDHLVDNVPPNDGRTSSKTGEKPYDGKDTTTDGTAHRTRKGKVIKK